MKKVLYHGSTSIIERPIFGEGNPHNDYGQGFYCTESLELAKEWACNDIKGGFANQYSLVTDGLKILDLSEIDFSILHWLALLTCYRTFRLTSNIAKEGKKYLHANFLPDISTYDLIVG